MGMARPRKETSRRPDEAGGIGIDGVASLQPASRYLTAGGGGGESTRCKLQNHGHVPEMVLHRWHMGAAAAAASRHWSPTTRLLGCCLLHAAGRFAVAEQAAHAAAVRDMARCQLQDIQTAATIKATPTARPMHVLHLAAGAR